MARRHDLLDRTDGRHIRLGAPRAGARRRRDPRSAARRQYEPPLPSTSSSRRYSAPAGLDLLFARDKHSIEPLLRAYEPDLAICSGFPWKIPQAALDVPRLGSINLHPALLPRHRGPIPLAWALRDGDPVWGMTWHRMDAELDTGNVLAQGSVPIEDDDVDIEQFAPKLLASGVELLAARARAGCRRRSRRPAAGGGSPAGPGTSRTTNTSTSTGRSPARYIHNQVRAWHLEFGFAGIRAPQAELERGAGRAQADAADRPRRRRSQGRVRRRADLGRRERAAL